MKRNIILIVLAAFTLFSCANKKMVTTKDTSLNGTWELNYISGPRIAFEGLYPDRKPTLVSGNSISNSFNGDLKIEGNKIDFNSPMAMTKMFCPGEGENVFIESLKKVNSYSVTDGNTLNLIMGDIAIMRFTKK
jgi:heat shock protein HslJ